MTKVIILSFILFSCIAYSQNQDARSSYFIKAGIGIGYKSQFGNFGIDVGFPVVRNFFLTISAGMGPFNGNGGIISFGAAYTPINKENYQLTVRSMWSYADGSTDILGDDDSNNYVWYDASRMQYLTSFITYSRRIEKDVILSFHGGYRHALTNLNYGFSGPGTPTQKQKNWLSTGLSSGWTLSITINGLFWLKKCETE